MFHLRPLVVIAFAAIMALVLGCSGGNTPVNPNQPSDTLDKVPIIGLTESNGTFDALGLLGAYEVTINPDNLTGEVVAKRLSAIGEDYIVSGAGFFTSKPCADCLRFTAVTLTPEGDAKLTFSIKHPFQTGDPTKPPSAINRKDLDVFDLAAVIVAKEATATSYALTGSSVYATACNRMDGLTTELAEVVADTAAMPYFLVVDNADTASSTYNKFAMGASQTFDVYINPAGGGVAFDMYLTMGYGASAKKAQRLTPSYFNPEFNRKAPWKIKITPPQGANPPIMGNTWNDKDATTGFPVKVEVYDWQIGATVDPLLGTPTSVFAASEISNVSLEIPGMNTTLFQKTTSDGGSGTPTSPLIYNFSVPNETLLPIGIYRGLVKVTDSRPVLTPADGRDFLIDSPDGIALNNYSMPEYATYQVFDATVVQGCGPINGQIQSPLCPVLHAGNGAIIPFTAVAQSANGGSPIVLYEWDQDYDGVNFTVDKTGATANLGPFTNPNCPGSNPPPVSYTVAVRAKDSCAVPNVTIFATCQVTVDMCAYYQELTNNFDNCTSHALTCENWTAGGCSLPNSDSYSWSHFAWGCAHGGSVSCVSGGYITSGGDVGGCSYLNDTAPTCNLNVVSPQFNLPSGTDSFFEVDHCNSFTTGGTLTAYITTTSPCGVTGWTTLGTGPAGAGCQNNTTWSLAAYSGATVRVRLQYTTGSAFGYNGACGQNAGIIIDNPRIGGTFGGSLAWN